MKATLEQIKSQLLICSEYASTNESLKMIKKNYQ